MGGAPASRDLPSLATLLQRFLKPLVSGALAVLLLCAGAAAAEGTVLEVIALRHRSVDQVLPVIRPLLDPGGSVSGLSGQLIVRTTPANLSQIRRVLAAIDAPPRRLVITVRQDSVLAAHRREAEVSGAVSLGDSAAARLPPLGRGNAGLEVEAASGEDRVRGHIVDTRSLENERNTQTLQVLEGAEAFISVGRSVPDRRVLGTPHGARVIDGAGYRSAQTGFYVLPQVSGDRVILQVSPQRERLSRDSHGAIETERLTTTVSARLGEWMEIGAAGEDGSESGSGIGLRSGASTVDRRRVLIKVEEAR